MSLQISFPAQEAPDENDGIRFPVLINGKRVGCQITVEALQDKFGMRDANSMKTFKAKRQAIENCVADMIREAPDATDYKITTN